MKKFDEKKFLSEAETLIYAGEPTKKNYPIFRIIVFFIVFIGVTVTDGFLVGVSVFKSVAGESLVGEIALYAVAFLLHLVPLVFWGFDIIVKIFYARNVRFIVTNERASIVRLAEKTIVETVFYSDVDDVKAEKDSVVFIVKEDRFVLKNLENASGIFDRIKDEIAK